jgi:hypothetical protein
MQGEYLRLVEQANCVGEDSVQTNDQYVSEYDDSMIANEAEGTEPELVLNAESVTPYFIGWLVSKRSDDSSYGNDINAVMADFRSDMSEVYGERVEIDDQTITIEFLDPIVKEVFKVEDEPAEDGAESTEDEVLTEPVEDDSNDTEENTTEV